MKITTIFLPDLYLECLEQFKDHYPSRSYIIREAIERFIEKEGKRNQQMKRFVEAQSCKS